MTNSLAHVGVLGMKWGRRKAKSSSGQSRSSEDHDAVAKIKTKKVSEMSNQELKTLTTRLQLEKQLKDLSKKEISGGQKFVSDVLTNVGKQMAGDFVKSVAGGVGSSVYKMVVKKISPEDLLTENLDKIKNFG